MTVSDRLGETKAWRGPEEEPDQGTAELGLAPPLAELVDAQLGNYLSPGQPTKLNLRRPLPAQSPRKCGTGSRVIGQRRHGASSAALRSAKVLLWLPVGSA